MKESYDAKNDELPHGSLFAFTPITGWQNLVKADLATTKTEKILLEKGPCVTEQVQIALDHAFLK